MRTPMNMYSSHVFIKVLVLSEYNDLISNVYIVPIILEIGLQFLTAFKDTTEK